MKTVFIIVILIIVIGSSILLINKKKDNEILIIEELTKRLTPKVPSSLNYNQVIEGNKIYSDTSFKFETSEIDSNRCFEFCSTDPKCKGVSLVQNRDKNKFECLFGNENSQLIDFEDFDNNQNYYKPFTYQKGITSTNQTSNDVYYVLPEYSSYGYDIPYYSYPYYGNWFWPGYYGGRKYWGGGKRPYSGGGRGGRGGRGGGSGGRSPGFSVRGPGISGAVGGGISGRGGGISPGGGGGRGGGRR